jgi:hypothetical protein
MALDRSRAWWGSPRRSVVLDVDVERARAIPALEICDLLESCPVQAQFFVTVRPGLSIGPNDVVRASMQQRADNQRKRKSGVSKKDAAGQLRKIKSGTRYVRTVRAHQKAICIVHGHRIGYCIDCAPTVAGVVRISRRYSAVASWCCSGGERRSFASLLGTDSQSGRCILARGLSSYIDLLLQSSIGTA